MCKLLKEMMNEITNKHSNIWYIMYSKYWFNIKLME